MDKDDIEFGVEITSLLILCGSMYYLLFLALTKTMIFLIPIMIFLILMWFVQAVRFENDCS